MDIQSWTLSSSQRVYPSTTGAVPQRSAIDAARNEQFSFQVALRNNSASPTEAGIVVESSCLWSLRVRTVGFVPVRHLNTKLAKNAEDVEGRTHIPGFVPDPLFDACCLVVPPRETHAFWITVRPDSPVPPGRHTICLRVTSPNARPHVHRIHVNVHDVLLPPRARFSISHWLYLDALMDWYHTDGFDERFWDILPLYLRNMSAHGMDTIYIPLFTPPLDGVKRPTQLLSVHKSRNARYHFDWADVHRFIKIAKGCGFRTFEWSHLFTQWGARGALRIYAGQGQDERLLWPDDTSATSPIYRKFLSELLPDLHKFLDDTGLIENSWFHISDEPHGPEHLENYRKARQMLGELAPWMRVMDALSETSLSTAAAIDMPIASIHTVEKFVKAGIPSWCYYCCQPRGAYLNRLMETPLAKIAMHGFLFYRWPIQGFLHWGYNYWHARQTRTLIDPFTVQDAQHWPEWAFGDPFVVYPGPNGPIDSIRWEVFGESLQDYALLQAANIASNHELLRPLASFRRFPKHRNWRFEARRKLFRILSKA